MLKQSVYNTIAAIGSTLGGLAAAGLARDTLSGALTGSRTGESHVSPQRVNTLLQQVKDQHGVDVGYLHSPGILGRSAGYMTPENVSGAVRRLRTLGDEASVSKLESARRPGGLVITGTQFKKPGVLEHELGHAIAANVGNPVERTILNENVQSAAPLYHDLPSLIMALRFGGKGPVSGALAGALTGALTNAPSLYAEYSANKYGSKLLGNKEDPDKNMSLLTYLASSAVPYGVTGALYGLLKKR